MTINTIFFDLDATLYPESIGLWQLIRERIDLFMQERLGLPLAQIPVMRHDYFTRYGTTLKGLQANYDVDPRDYLTFVHDLPLDAYLQPTDELHCQG